MLREEKEFATWRLFSDVKAKDCAFLVIDMQNDFVHPNGHYAKWGIDIGHMKRTVQPIKRFIDYSRRRNIPVIGARFVVRGAVDGGITCKKRAVLTEAGLRENTWGVEIIDELGISPSKGDWIIDRQRMSCFFATRLEYLLRSLQRKTIILSGVVTSSCVESTARDAQFRDFEVIVLADCVGGIGGTMVDPITRTKVQVRAEDMHNASLRVIQYVLGEVMTSDELIEELEKLSERH